MSRLGAIAIEAGIITGLVACQIPFFSQALLGAAPTPTPLDPSRIPSIPFNPTCNPDPRDETDFNKPLPKSVSKGALIKTRTEEWKCVGSLPGKDGAVLSFWVRSLLPFANLKEIVVKSNGAVEHVDSIQTTDFFLDDPPAGYQIQVNVFDGSYRVYPVPVQPTKTR